MSRIGVKGFVLSASEAGFSIWAALQLQKALLYQRLKFKLQRVGCVGLCRQRHLGCTSPFVTYVSQNAATNDIE